MKAKGASLVVAMLAVAAGQAAALDIETVPVGNVGNTDDVHGHGYGAVDYEYNIGKYEVTAGQYTEFLNAVAATDAYGLYNASMDSDSFGCQITQNGVDGNYTYDFSGRPSGTEANWVDRPVNYVDWGDAARFANWLTNGQGNGSTETGAYNLSGAMSNTQLMAVVVPTAAQRETWSNGAKPYFLLTSEDEWYKAAYYKGGSTNAGYWDFPTSSNTAPGRDMSEATNPGNNANYRDGRPGYLIGSPYYRTEVGEFEESNSPYDTFDQGGNVWEWNEAILYGSSRGLRGGSFMSLPDFDYWLPAPNRGYYGPAGELYDLGFRVSEVPEPATLFIMTAAGLPVLLRRRRRRSRNPELASGLVLGALAMVRHKRPFSAHRRATPMKQVWVVGAVFLLGGAGIALARTPAFTGLGDLTGGETHSAGYGMSGDGLVVVGWSSSDQGSEAFRWTASQGMVGLGHLDASDTRSFALAVSGDGSVVVGTSSTNTGVPEAFSWTAPDGMARLSGVAGHSAATDISTDGTVVVGYQRIAYGVDWTVEAFRWTAGAGPVGLGDLAGDPYRSVAQAVSGDGRTVVGYSSSSYSYSDTFVWTETEGMVGLGVNSDENYHANGISSDGSLVIGNRFRWTRDTGVTTPNWSYALDTAADGSVVVGKNPGFVWDAEQGSRDLMDMLEHDFGLDLVGWTWLEAYAVSDDGLVIAGAGGNPDGNIEAFIAVIPEPTTLSLVAMGGLALLRRRRGYGGQALMRRGGT